MNNETSRRMAEVSRRAKILADMDQAAYDSAGCLMALVDRGIVKQPTAVNAINRFRAAMADYRATNVIDKAATP